MANKLTNESLIFEDKVVSFSTVDETLALKNIKLETIASRLFLTGEIPKGATRNDWAEGRSSAIAWDSVTDYIMFESENQYVELMRKSEQDD